MEQYSCVGISASLHTKVAFSTHADQNSYFIFLTRPLNLAEKGAIYHIGIGRITVIAQNDTPCSGVTTFTSGYISWLRAYVPVANWIKRE